MFKYNTCMNTKRVRISQFQHLLSRIFIVWNSLLSFSFDLKRRFVAPLPHLTKLTTLKGILYACTNLNRYQFYGTCRCLPPWWGHLFCPLVTRVLSVGLMAYYEIIAGIDYFILFFKFFSSLFSFNKYMDIIFRNHYTVYSAPIDSPQWRHNDVT